MDPAGVDVKYRILGPLEVSVDGETVDLGPRKQRTLFAMLLVNHDRTVTTDALLDALWGSEADGKENALWVYVSRLRSLLSDFSSSDVLVTADRGYRVELGRASYDVDEFEEHYRLGTEAMLRNPRAAADEFSEALGVWRGSVLEEFRYEEFAQPEITRLEGLRNACTLAKLDAELRTGGGPELIGEIEALVDAHPFEEQPVSLLMRAQYRAGRQADALRAYERYRRRLGEEIGTDPSPELRRLEEQILLHDERIAVRPSGGDSLATDVGPNPYKGLEPFGENDSSVFFGRDRLVGQVARGLDSETIVTVIGPSGSGKSSAVRSGLIPAIRKGSLPGSDDWLVATMLPGSMPFAELEAALLRSSIDVPDSLTDQLDGGSDSIIRAVLRILPSETSTLLLVIDQLEELFTMTDPAEAAAFLGSLVVAADDPRRRIRVVSTLRADFYGEALSHPSFARRMGEGIVNVVPMAPEELEEAASQPAASVGVRLEPGLEAALIGDVLGEPGALPLFQFALTDLFDRRVGDTLTLDAYRTMGGVDGALSRKAEYLYEGLSQPEREAAKQVFLRLVTLSDSHTRSRRRVEASELLGLDLDVGDLQGVIDAFGSHRLLTFDRNDVTGSPTVEVAHEALLERWDRLAQWITDARMDVENNASLRVMSAEWYEHERDARYLLVGGRLDDYREWSENSVLVLAEPERAFLDASIAAVDDRERREAERVAREQATSRRARRNAWLLAAVVVAVVAAGSYLLWAVTRPAGPSVVLVHDGLEESGIQSMVLAGARRAADELPIEMSERVVVADISEKFDRLAGEADLLVGGIDYSGYVFEAAASHPDTHFVNVDSFPIDAANVTNALFANNEGAYLMGVAAASTTESGMVGYIGASQAPLLIGFYDPYHQGVHSVDPSITILTDYVSPAIDGSNNLGWFWEGFWRDDMAYDAAMGLFEQGVDVVFTVAGSAGSGSVRAAADFSEANGTKVWAIGVDVDQGFLTDERYAPYVLTSMLKNFDVAVFEAIRAYTEDAAENTLLLDLANDGIGYSDYGSRIRSLAPLLDATASGIMDGSIAAHDYDPDIYPTIAWRSDPDSIVEVTLDDSSCATTPQDPIITAGETVALVLSGPDSTHAYFAIDLIPTDDELRLGTESAFFPLALAEPSRPFEFRIAVPGAFQYAVVQCWSGDQDPWVDDPAAVAEPITIAAP